MTEEEEEEINSWVDIPDVCEKHNEDYEWIEYRACEICDNENKLKAKKLDEIKEMINPILIPNKDFDGEVALAQGINKIIERK